MNKGGIYVSEIQTNKKITYNDISALKQAIIDIYANRTHLTDAGITALDINSITINQYDVIGSNLYSLLNALLKLGDIDKIIVNNQYNKIIQDGPITTELLATLQTNISTKWETTDTHTNPSHSCRGGCVGFCWN